MAPQIEDFIVDTLLLDPMSKIIKQLEDRKFRDSDIKWLDSQLEKFMGIAAETFNIKISKGKSKALEHMNTYAYEFYLTKFSALHSYFKTF